MSEEHLHSNSPLPVDRETSVPLAEILFPEDIQKDRPLFEENVANALDTIVEEWAILGGPNPIGIDPPMSCLVHGEPGTGKTHMALWLTRELGLPVVAARLDGLVSSFLGTTARNIGNLFDFANRHRCVLLLDEFDAIAKLRDDPQEVGEIKRVVNALLQNLDSRSRVGLTIGITNHERLLDPAVWRRFEVQLEIPAPGFKVRVELARHFLAPAEVPDSHVRLMAWVTNGRTGAEIELLARAYKMALLMDEEGRADVVRILRNFGIRNSARVDSERSRVLTVGFQGLVHALRNDHDLGFTIADIAEITGKDKSTVSRKLRKPLAAGDEDIGNG